MSEDWDWKLTDRSKRQFEALDEYARDRIISKLEEVVTDQWREPTDYLEPLAGAPHQKLRVGQFRLGCRADREQRILALLKSSESDTSHSGSGQYRPYTNVNGIQPMLRDRSCPNETKRLSLTKVDRLKEWMDEVRERESEVIETFQSEGMLTEAAFLEQGTTACTSSISWKLKTYAKFTIVQ